MRLSAWLSGISLIGFAAAQHALGQGTVRLHVTDVSGAPMEAQAAIEPLATGSPRRFQTDRTGLGVVSGLAPGEYRLSVFRAGFARYRSDLNINSSAPAEVNVSLTIQDSGFSVDVVSGTPLAGSELDRDQVPAPVQTAVAADLANSRSVELGSYLNRRFTGVYVNEVQGNPFQPDVNFRGYTASPLLGTPQGLSLYMDGVRLNQPFGDVVSWDLVPRIAIAETTLIPGSNPLFGLNTLGGAIAVETKDGLTAPGSTLTLSGGSWGRKIAELEHGGWNRRGWSWYGAANLFFEDGWRSASPSNVRQFFGKVGRQRGKTSAFLSFSYANNLLIGNGLQDQRLLARDYGSIYTKPDQTSNRSPFVNLTLRNNPRSSVSISGNVYYRAIQTKTLNGDINEDSLDQSVYQPSAADIRALTAAGYSGFPLSGATAQNTPFPFWRCIAQVLQRDEPAEKCNGLLNRSRITQQNYGISGQATWSVRHNQVTVGSAFDRRTSGYGMLSQLGYLNPDRSVTPVNAFADGITGGNVDGEAFDTRVNLDGRANTVSFYASDTFSFARKWSVTLAGRYNRNSIRNFDGFTPGGGPGSLDSNNVFERFNPGAGITYRANPWATLYFSFSEGSRAPTSTELGCADPQEPCRLPNALAGDPPLKQVVTRTFEAGFRGGTEATAGWSVGWFRSENRDDLLFASSTQTGFGYFRNFGKTRRQGMEANLHGRIRTVDWGANYTFLDATFQSPETVNGANNNTNDGGLIQITPGDRIPLVPGNIFKAYALWNTTKRLVFTADMTAIGRSFARGNENNLAAVDGPEFQGPGISPGYALLNLGGHFDLHRRVRLIGQINNLADRRYYSGAQLGPTGFMANGAFLARPFPVVNGEYPLQSVTFYAPGAPRTIWGGLQFRF